MLHNAADALQPVAVPAQSGSLQQLLLSPLQHTMTWYQRYSALIAEARSKQLESERVAAGAGSGWKVSPLRAVRELRQLWSGENAEGQASRRMMREAFSHTAASWHLLLLVLLVSLAGSYVTIRKTTLLAQLFDGILSSGLAAVSSTSSAAAGSSSSTSQLLLAYFGLYVADDIIDIFASNVTERLRSVIELRARLAFYAGSLKQEAWKLNDQRSAQDLQRAMNEAAFSINDTALVPARAIRYACSFVAGVWSMISISWSMTLAASLLRAPLSLNLASLSASILQHHWAIAEDQMSRTNFITGQALQNARFVQLHAAEDEEVGRYAQQLAENEEVASTLRIVEKLLARSSGLLWTVYELGTLYCGVQLMLAGRISLAQLQAFKAYQSTSWSSFEALLHETSKFRTNAGKCQLYFSMLDGSNEGHEAVKQTAQLDSSTCSSREHKQMVEIASTAQKQTEPQLSILQQQEKHETDAVAATQKFAEPHTSTAPQIETAAAAPQPADSQLRQRRAAASVATAAVAMTMFEELNASQPAVKASTGPLQLARQQPSLAAAGSAAAAAMVVAPIQPVLMSHLLSPRLGLSGYEAWLHRGPMRGAISLESVSFRYPASQGNKESLQPALQNLTLHVPAGCRMAIVGPSGSGKSTLFRLLTRQYMPSAGRVCIDGIATQAWHAQALRRQLVLVEAEPTVLAGSLRENILYGLSPASLLPGQEMPGEAQLQAAAAEACLGQFVASLPDGYNTRVGDRGIRLSSGQKQRLALCRAYVRNPVVLLGDEVTGALDAELEEQVKRGLLAPGRTLIMVTHRLSTCLGCDLVAVMREGRLVEQGTHEQLLARGGVYRRMVELQQLSTGVESSVQE